MPRERLPRDPERRKKSIIEAAAKLAILHGPYNVTHRMIAAEAGVSLGSTTAYFASLNNLMTEAFQWLSEVFDRDISAMLQEMRESGTPEVVLARVLTRGVEDRFRARGQMMFVLQSIDNPAMQKVSNVWFDAIENVMREFTSPVAARAIAIYCDGFLVQVARSGNYPTEKEIITAFRALMSGA
ncbi:TetR/AcrR family transcriptional regulator [Corynebacterium pelargi]|uniref:TetR/AcrR family transcriptional regulator n=1 Tax=Corynebacterium pelargi TaxID=1471400 RepID=UPI0013E8B456|nr:TetR family transcriptional regulator [Corynebacterium pelargi]